MRKLTPSEMFSGAAAAMARALRDSSARHDLCQDAIGACVNVSQQTVNKWMSSQKDDSPPLARVAMMPREVVVDIARALLADHHATVVDLLHFGVPGTDPDACLWRELDAAQLGAAQAVHAILVAAADRVISSAEATTVRAAIRDVVEPLMALDRRMARIEENGAEGVGRAH